MLNRFLIYLFLCSSKAAFSTSFPYPENLGDKLIGDNTSMTETVFAKEADTLLDIARDFDIGQNEILRANPTVDRWLPGKDTAVIIPHSRLLPGGLHQGVVLNLPEFRLYYYPKKNKGHAREVITHPVSVGRVDWNTPLGKTRIIRKIKDPSWRPPKSIREEHAVAGEILPEIFPAGPDNPLGLFALRLNMPGYLIHGTNKPYGVGMRVSHGCVRMYPEDIEKLFHRVNIGTTVNIINQPIKVGWSDDILYIEVHPDMEDEELSFEDRLNIALGLIEKANNQQAPVINNSALKQALLASNGIPVPIFSKRTETDLFHH